MAKVKTEGATPMLMSVESAAPLIGLGEGALRASLDDAVRPLPHVRVGRHRLINMAHVQEWLDAQTVGLAGE